jgi:electron transfer flavoprotein alpha subunit
VDRTMSVLVIGHVEPDGTLARPTLEAVGAGQELASALGLPLAIGLIGADVARAAGLVASAGAARVLGVEGPSFGQARYASDAAAAEAIVKAAGTELVVAPGTSRWMRVAGGVAQRLGGRVDTHVTAVRASDGGVSVTRWFYKQRIEGTVTRAERPWLVLLEPGAREAWSGAAGTVAVESVAVDLPELRTEVTGVRAPAAADQTVRPDADILFVAGAGWTKKQSDGRTRTDEAQAAILGFLRAAQASLGGSKSVVDQGADGQPVLPFMTHLNQVGQTGASPRHPKGLATCCHGEEPHVIGWRFVPERRAINMNPNCGWAQGKADVLYVADAFEVIGKVNDLLARKGSGDTNA